MHRRDLLKTLSATPVIASLLPRTAQAKATSEPKPKTPRPGEYAHHRFIVRPEFRFRETTVDPGPYPPPELALEYKALEDTIAAEMGRPEYRAIDATRPMTLRIVDHEGNEWGGEYADKKPVYWKRDRHYFVRPEIWHRQNSARSKAVNHLIATAPRADLRALLYGPSPLDRQDIDHIEIGFWYVVLAK